MSDPIPNWLTEELEDNLRIPLLDYHVYLDHFEKRKRTKKMQRTTSEKIGETFYISQPYDPLSYYDMKHLISVCDKHGIRFDIRADSDHYPGRTLMIEWWKAGEKEEGYKERTEDHIRKNSEGMYYVDP
jgi:hypothetical protein